MSKLIFTRDNSIEPNGMIGIQQWGIIFWQKTGFLRHCSEFSLKSIVALIDKKFSPLSILESCRNVYFIHFGNDKAKIIFLTLKRERNSKRLFLYGESHTVYADAEFHILALEIVSYIAKQIGCKFFVDDGTGYLEHRSKQRLEQHMKEFAIKPAVSEDLLRKAIIEHQNRMLDITEILSRETERDVVIDVYEYFMRQSNWKINDRFNNTVRNFLLCVSYDGEIANDGISQFLSDINGNIGAIEAEKLLRKSFLFFPNGIVPKNREARNEFLHQIDDTILCKLDRDAYDADVYNFCYRYLINNKSDFVE